jgi:hypothetical protein
MEPGELSHASDLLRGELPGSSPRQKHEYFHHDTVQAGCVVQKA